MSARQIGNPYDKDIIATIFKHAFTEALFEGAQGGNMFHGAIMGALSTGGNTYIKGLKVSDGIKILASSVLGGTVSEIGGGKFANGAMTAAYTMMFNDLRHQNISKKKIKSLFDKYLELTRNDNKEQFNSLTICEIIGGELTWLVPSIVNGCAIKLSYAMNYCGMKIPRIKGLTYKGNDGLNYFIRAKDMNNYLEGTYNFCTIKDGRSTNYGIVYEYPDDNWRIQGITGHVDVVYNYRWASNNGQLGAPHGKHITNVFH